MGEAIGQILPNAVGVALSPLPIIGLILMLLGKRARANGLTFLLGWIVGLTVVGVVIFAISSGADASSDDGSTADWVGWFKIVLGILFGFLAVRNWRERPAPGEKGEMPGWMDSVADFTPPKAAGLAFVMSAVNPKNLALTAAAVASIAATDLSGGESAVVFAVFVAIASVTILVPVIAYFAMGSKADAVLGSWRTWLEHNNNTVMAVVLVVFGIKLIGDGISVLGA
jgi:threonine/homoserine/homoserine lactone efflux protein